MRIIKNIIFVLFLLVSLTYLFIVVSPKVFKNFYPFGIRTAIVLTGSMEPTLEINDFVITKYPDDVKINDIVSYKEETSKTETLHRIVKIDGDKITTKGDANNTEDKPIDRSQITGIYIGRSKFLGKMISAVTSPVGFTITIILICIIMILPSRKHFFK